MSTQKLASRDTPTSEVINVVSDGTELAAVIYPSGATPVVNSSASVANAAAVATLAGVAAKTTYLSGFEITGGGSTAAAIAAVTVSGILGGSLNYTYGFALGAGVGNVPLIVEFNPPLPSSAVNTSIVVTCAAGGAGNLANTCVAHGFVK